MGQYKNGRWEPTFGDVQFGMSNTAPGELPFDSVVKEPCTWRKQMTNTENESLYIVVTNEDGSTTEIGNWILPDETLSNFANQQDIGWHIFCAVQKGAKSIRIIKRKSRESE